MDGVYEELSLEGSYAPPPFLIMTGTMRRTPGATVDLESKCSQQFQIPVSFKKLETPRNLSVLNKTYSLGNTTI